MALTLGLFPRSLGTSAELGGAPGSPGEQSSLRKQPSSHRLLALVTRRKEGVGCWQEEQEEGPLDSEGQGHEGQGTPDAQPRGRRRQGAQSSPGVRKGHR